MAGITLEQAQAQLELYLTAEAKVLQGQSYEIAGRKMTRADLETIQAGIKVWDERVKVLSNRSSGGGRSRTVVVG